LARTAAFSSFSLPDAFRLLPPPLSSHEKEICARLRKFRRALDLSQDEFAQRIGIKRERLASYEHSRARLRWGVFLQLARALSVNPVWLATGDGPMRAYYLPEWEQLSIAPEALFSSVFAEHLQSEAAMVKAAAAFDRISSALADLETLAPDVHASPAIDPRAARAAEFALSNLEALRDDIAATSERLRSALEPPVSARGKIVPTAAAETLTPRGVKTLSPRADTHRGWAVRSHAPHNENEGLQSSRKLEESLAMPTAKQDLESLLSEVRKLTAKRGEKQKLAAALGVAPKRVSEWLAGTYVPDGMNTLRLLRWVRGEKLK
jgi:transcriptional regulator with XRE-family HTH domain